MMTAAFYDELAPFYHLLFPDWEASIRRQAAALDALIRERFGEARLDILDAACGIGTQALGLAALGHRVTGSDLSAAAVERARQEAARRSLSLGLSVADMRHAFDHHRRQFGGSSTHLLTYDLPLDEVAGFVEAERLETLSRAVAMSGGQR
jgi:2-polyprenyl-3-methyl-5-hydroxy-6-metoxy-1,4-benzoquinol methylase